MKQKNLLTLLHLAPAVLFGQTDSINQVIDLESVTIQAVRANDKTPVSFQTMNKTEIERLNNVSNIPVLLQLMPSVVATTENGTATGNTSFRIRGTDASRTNVTMNGLPLNNPESQEVFWVNLPNLAGFLNSVQIQRGVGTSSNGSGAFGASVNLETDKISTQPDFEASLVGGSFNTFGVNVTGNPGYFKKGGDILFKNNPFDKIFLEMKMSSINSDGYIRNGKLHHTSAYMSIGFVKPKHFLKLNYLSGSQRTGITWEGASAEDIAKDRRYNPAGYMYTDTNGNRIYYDNETDNYTSNILQAFYVFNLSEYWTFNTGFNYTNGFGYYENYRTGQRFSRIGLPNLNINGTVYDRSDIIRQKLMRNNFYATNANFLYSKNNLNVNIGGHYSHYVGDYYGNLKWIKVYEELKQNIPPNHEWYKHQGKKSEVSVFSKFDYTFLQKFNAFLDMQFRHVRHGIHGIDDDNNLTRIDFEKTYPFFNPKIGLSYLPDAHQKWYVSIAKASREPARADIKEVFRAGETAENMIKPEHLVDYELGYQIQKEHWGFGANFYFMDYNDQLVPNGRISTSGYKLMDNIEKSYRTGIELVGGYQICKPLKIDANLTLSQSKARNMVRPIIDQGDWSVGYEVLKSSDLAFSPNVVGAGMLTYSPISNFNIMLTGKYVGKQFFDNLSTSENALKAYFISDFSVYYERPLKKENRKIYVQGVINNLFNKDYISNAWVDATYFSDGTDATYRGFFAQAPIHFSIKLGFKL